MRKYTDCYIAFIDILGFKSLVNNLSCEDIASLFDEINTEFVISAPNNDTWVDSKVVKKKVMSDTICFYVDSSEPDALAKIVAACAYFQVKLMSRPNPILSRGAIVKDNIYNNEDITFGPGVSKAYLLEEKAAVTPRIIIDNQLHEYRNKGLTPIGEKYLEMYLYEDYDYTCVDSLFLFYSLRHEKDTWKQFAQHVLNEINSESDERVLNKYKYTYHRFSEITDKFSKFK